MQNGIYRYCLEMAAPLGKRFGSLSLVIQENHVGGELTLLAGTFPVTEGCRTGNRLRFTGEMKTLVNRIPYMAEGTVNTDCSRIDLVFFTQRDAYPAVGRRESIAPEEPACT